MSLLWTFRPSSPHVRSCCSCRETSGRSESRWGEGSGQLWAGVRCRRGERPGLALRQLPQRGPVPGAEQAGLARSKGAGPTASLVSPASSPLPLRPASSSVPAAGQHSGRMFRGLHSLPTQMRLPLGFFRDAPGRRRARMTRRIFWRHEQVAEVLGARCLEPEGGGTGGVPLACGRRGRLPGLCSHG